MVIERIALKNIKIYSETEILLHPGVNFIKGKNGAGKSTLIECIGYALFNYTDAKNVNEDFLTYGKTDGLIEIDFTGVQQKKYTVVRAISVKQNKRGWNIYERGSDTPVELYYEEEKQAFLAEAMGLGKERDTAWLFKDIIGVRQGAFKEPFEKSPEERKKYFNRIFGVEEYTKAFDQLSQVTRELNGREKLVEKDIGYMNEAVKGLDEKREEAKALKAAAAESEKLLNNIQKDLKNTDIQLSALREVRDQNTHAEKLLATCEQNLKNLQALLLEKEKQKNSSLEAKERQKENEKGYRAYLDLKQALAMLDKKAAEKRRLLQLAADTQNALGKLETQLSAENKMLQQNEHNIKTEKNELKQTKERLGSILSELQEQSEKNSKISAQIENIEKNAARFESYIEKGKGFVENSLNTHIVQYERLSSAMSQLRSEIDALNGLLPLEKKLEDAKKQSEELKKTKSVLEEKLLTMGKYEAELEKGACPFFEGECMAAKKQGKAGFQKQKDDIIKTLEEIAQNLKENEKELSSLSPYEGIRVKHQTAVEKLSENQKEMLSCKDSLSELAVKPASWDMAQKIRDIEAEFLAVSGEATGESATVPLFTDYLGLLNADPYEAAKKYVQAFNALSVWLQTFKDRLHAFSFKQKSAAGDIRTNAATVTAEIQNAVKRFDVLTAQEKELDAVRESIVQLERQKKDAVKDNETLFNELKTYDGLEKETEANKAEAALKEEDFQKYIKNETEANKLQDVIRSIDETMQSVEQEKIRAEDLKKKLCEYALSYDTDKEKALQEKAVELNGKKGELTEKITQSQKDALRLQKEIEEKQEAQAKLLALVKRREGIKEAAQIIANVRAAMKIAGPKIASIFRSRIEARADSIYRNVSREGVNLLWTDSYEVELHDIWKGQQRKRVFKQLSGGEKMTAALAVRLSLLDEFSAAKIGFFDEPTDNMDVSRKENLADILSALCSEFSQVFVISHDDTFDKMTDNVIYLSADNTGTIVL